MDRREEETKRVRNKALLRPGSGERGGKNIVGKIKKK